MVDYGSQFSVMLDDDTVIITPNNGSPIFDASTDLQPPFEQLVDFITEDTPIGLMKSNVDHVSIYKNQLI